MNLSYRSEYTEEVKTLKLKHDLLKIGIGYIEDVEGNTWDIVSIIGKNYSPNGKAYINARLVDNTPYYSTDNRSHGNGVHKWIPYYYEVVK